MSKPWRITINMNGVECFLMTNSYEGFEYVPSNCKRHVSGPWYLVFNLYPDVGTLLTAAGYDTSKIDYAYPHEWAVANSSLIQEQGDGACWSYEDESLMGFPIFYSEIWARILARASMYVRPDYD